MNARFVPGELVDLTIRGARVGEGTPRHQQFLTGGGDLFIAAELLPSITIERVAPAEWPPQPGDLWEDRHGSTWFSFRDPRGVVLMKPGDPTSDTIPSPDTVLTNTGPLALVYRKGWTPEPAVDVDQADEAKLDERAAKVAGLRELADFVESHPDLPIRKYGSPLTLTLFVDDHDELERVAAMLGVEPDSRTVPPHPGARHRYARKTLTGGVKIEAVICDVYPQAAAPDVAPVGEEVAGPVPEAGPATAPGDGHVYACCGKVGRISRHESWCSTVATAPDFELGPVPDADGDLIAAVDDLDEFITEQREQDPAFAEAYDRAAEAEAAERNALTDEQIDGALVELVQVLDASPELLADKPAVEQDADALDQLGVAATDPAEVDD